MVVGRSQARIEHQAECRLGHAPPHEVLGPPPGLHAQEGQRVGGLGRVLVGTSRLPVHESALTRALFGLGKQLVDGPHQRLGRAVVGAQHVVPAGGGFAGLEVGVDVGPPEAVDRLLGVADQHQRGVGRVVGNAVEAVEDAALQGRGVLELVDQGHRVLGEDALAQPLGGLAVVAGVQRLVEPVQHVGEAEAAGLLLERGQAVADAHGRMQAQRGAHRRQGRQIGQQLLEGGKVLGQADRGPGLERLVHALRHQAGGGAGAQGQLVTQRVGRPGHQGVEPGGVVARVHLRLAEGAVGARDLGIEPAAQGLGPRGPAALELLERRLALGLHPADQLAQVALPGAIGQRLLDQRAGVAGQGLQAFPHGQHRVQRLGRPGGRPAAASSPAWPRPAGRPRRRPVPRRTGNRCRRRVHAACAGTRRRWCAPRRRPCLRRPWPGARRRPRGRRPAGRRPPAR